MVEVVEQLLLLWTRGNGRQLIFGDRRRTRETGRSWRRHFWEERRENVVLRVIACVVVVYLFGSRRAREFDAAGSRRARLTPKVVWPI